MDVPVIVVNIFVFILLVLHPNLRPISRVALSSHSTSLCGRTMFASSMYAIISLTSPSMSADVVGVRVRADCCVFNCLSSSPKTRYRLILQYY